MVCSHRRGIGEHAQTQPSSTPRGGSPFLRPLATVSYKARSGKTSLSWACFHGSETVTRFVRDMPRICQGRGHC